jgi:predicted anti-sigma-YlaC factor YlaD
MNLSVITHSRLLLVALALPLIAGCSIQKMAARKMGDTLAAGGAVYASDNDPELIRDASPFSLKLMESVLTDTPNHRGLLLALTRGFTQYSYAFVQEDADEVEDRDLAKSKELKIRARKLYLRARDYGLRDFEVIHPGFEISLRQDARAAVRQIGREDVPLLYWTAAAWGAAISVSKDQPDLVADQPIVEALIDRALELDETFGSGAIHSFLISYESARKGVKGDPAERSRRHFERAVELSVGKMASPYVACAETVCVAKQQKAEFQSLLNQALAINPDDKPEWRLANLVAQRRARWLLGRTEELFAE